MLLASGEHQGTLKSEDIVITRQGESSLRGGGGETGGALGEARSNIGWTAVTTFCEIVVDL